MSDRMEFPETFEKFAEQYGFKDDKEVYTNGSDLIQIFRVRQWLEHDNKLRTIEIDTAYECGKYAKVEANENIKLLGEELRKFREGITDEKVLSGFNMAIAICNKYLEENDYLDKKSESWRIE